VWDHLPTETPDGPSVSFRLVSPDGDEGYPGTLTTSVTYTLTHQNELKIVMEATTDKATIVNLAHHTYWNLAGHASGDVLGQEMQIFAERYTPTDETLIPTGQLAPVAGTPFDFRKPKALGKDIGALKAQAGAAHGGGYDLNFAVDGQVGTLRPAARVADLKSGRTMELYSDQPGVQLYTANGLSGSGKGGATYKAHQGFCLETQKFPDSINKPEWRDAVVLKPGQTYRHTMVHRFGGK
jgi:aldose 1-epimerase